MEEFINLHNRTVSRSEVERVVSLAKEQNNTEVIYRLSRILNAYPTEQRFVINIKDYPTTPTALAGAHHTGDYREALDENGRLRKGYKFVKGKIIPPQPFHLSAPSHLSDDELTFLAAAGIDYFEQAPDDEAKGLGKPIPAADIYKMITDKIIKMLKSTKASDYKKTWEDDAFFIPINFDSKKPYRGVNRMLLQERIGLTEAFANPYFLTFKQIKKHKGTLKKGAKGYEVVYYSIRYVVPADKNSGRKAYSSTNAHKVIDFLDKHKLPENIVTRIPMIRYYNVYNGEDITGIDFKLPEVKIGRAIPETASENEAAQLIVENYPNPPAIKHGGNEAYYKLSEDLVRMPKIEQFDSVNDYYRTLFHELTHSTRHESRLNREKISFRFGDSGYAKEELVAEFGAVFLSAWAGIMWYNNKNHAAYLKGWNSAIKEAENDNKFLMKAASLAQAATDYILNLDAAGQPAFLSKYEKLNKKAEKPKPEATKAKKNTKVAQYTGVKTIPLSDLYTDEKRFQNSKKLNEEIVENIVNNFKPTDLDPLVVWYDKKQGKTFVLAGHHRFEALKRLKHKNVPVKFANDDYPTEADAIRYAKEISNANRTLEEPYERAAIYRKYREEGYSEREINDKAALEGKNRSYILNLSCLNPKGATMSTLVQFSQTQSKADKNEAERVADWIGQARRNAPELTDAHEKEMFDFLMNKEASKRTTTKVKFLEYVRACWNPFEPTAPLNLARMKYQSEGEKQYDEEVERYKTLISDLQNNIGNLKDRFINPTNKDFVNPEAPDYMAVKKIADNKIAEYNTQIQYYQKELLKLYSNKQSYLKPTGQIALFGKYPEIDTARLKKMKVNELREFTLKYYNLYLKGEKENVEKHLKEVIFTTKAGRKIAYGEAMYSAKAAVITHLKTLIKNSTYNNWGERKPQDNPNILGYLNFKSKITIDGQKRHLRISVIVDKERNLELKSYDIGKKKSQAPKGTLPSAEGAQLPTNTPAKTVPNTLANRQIDKLANPIMPPTVYVEHLPEETNQQISTSANTLDAKMAALQTRNWETFVIANPQLQRFLGDVERKTSESTVITIAGGAGSGKTRFAFQFINALAQNYKVGHASLEEHPDSKLYYDKVQQYIDETALPNIEAPEIKNLDQLEALIQRNEVIVIDSFAKLQELNPRFLLDRDLRKKYDGKLFLLIYQLTGEGKMRGGSKSEYDGDIILLTHVAPDYRENYIYPSKNRYNALPATQLRYSTYFQQMLDIPKELGTGSRPPEAISLPPAPQTNVYEVIY